MADDAPLGDNDDRPDWLPEKFKTVDAYNAAYEAAERKITEQGNQLTSQNETLQTFAQQLEELSTQRTQPQADQSSVNNQWAEMYENDPLGTMVLLNQELSKSNLEAIRQEISQLSGAQQSNYYESIGLNAKREMQSRHGDWDELEADVKAEIDNNPIFNQDSPVWQTLPGATAAFDQAYRNVKATKEPDEQHSFGARDMKLQAQGLQGAGGRPAPEDEQHEAWERIRNAGKNSTYSELRARS